MCVLELSYICTVVWILSWRGANPSFYSHTMIGKERIEELLREELGEGPIFPVDVTVSGQNDIRILIDNDEGVSINDCVKVSRLIEGSLDREVEDFALQVLSFGADQALRLTRQYRKNTGREVRVKRKEGEVLSGLLVASDEECITLKIREKRRLEGKKKKEWVEEEIQIPYGEITETKVILSFK